MTRSSPSSRLGRSGRWTSPLSAHRNEAPFNAAERPSVQSEEERSLCLWIKPILALCCYLHNVALESARSVCFHWAKRLSLTGPRVSLTGPLLPAHIVLSLTRVHAHTHTLECRCEGSSRQEVSSSLMDPSCHVVLIAKGMGVASEALVY